MTAASPTTLATSIATTTKTTTILYPTSGKIILKFKTIFLNMARFVAIETNRWVSNIPQNHWRWSFIRGVSILGNVLKIHILISATKIAKITTCTTTHTTTAITIVLTTTIRLLLQYTVLVRHERLVSTFSKKYHILKCVRTMHKHFFFNMGF